MLHFAGLKATSSASSREDEDGWVVSKCTNEMRLSICFSLLLKFTNDFVSIDLMKDNYNVYIEKLSTG